MSNENLFGYKFLTVNEEFFLKYFKFIPTDLQREFFVGIVVRLQNLRPCPNHRQKFHRNHRVFYRRNIRRYLLEFYRRIFQRNYRWMLPTDYPSVNLARISVCNAVVISVGIVFFYYRHKWRRNYNYRRSLRRRNKSVGDTVGNNFTDGFCSLYWRN